MTVCLDASILTKLTLREADSERARSLVTGLLRQEPAFSVPQLALAECISAVHQRLRAGETDVADAYMGITVLEEILQDRVVQVPLARRTLEIAAELNVRYPYDSMYLALAEALDCDLWTADAAFHRVASPVYPRVHLLAEFAD